MTDKDKLLYDIAYHELEKEMERKENIETKAQRFVIFGSIFLSIISTYFLIFFTGEFDKIYLCILFFSLFGLTASIFMLIYSIRTFHYPHFDMGIFLVSSLSLEYDKIVKSLTRIFAEFIEKSRDINNYKVKWLFYGIKNFFLSLILMVIGILLLVINI